MAEDDTVQTDYGSDDPIWIDEAWLDTVVVIGLTCFVLCLMNLNKVRKGWNDGAGIVVLLESTFKLSCWQLRCDLSVPYF